MECTEDEIQEMMNEYDYEIGKDGKIDFEHFRTIMMSDNTPARTSSGYPRKFDTFSMSPVGPSPRGQDNGDD